MSTNNQIGQFPTLLSGEEKTLTFQFDDELPIGATLTGTPSVEVTVIRGADANPSQFALAAGFDAGERNVCLVVKGLVRSVEYEIRVLATTSDAQHKPGRVGRILVK